MLLIGAETNSYFLQHVPQARGPAILFGDGAGAVVLRAGTADEPGAIGPFDLGSDGGAADLIRIESGGSRQRARAAAAEPSAKEAPEDLYWSVSGQEVYRRAIEHMTQSSLRVLRAAGRTVADLDRFVAHQANQRILDRVAELVGVDVDRRIGNVATVGNTGAASIPLALGDACRAGLLRAGHRLLATSFGGGPDLGLGAADLARAGRGRHRAVSRRQRPTRASSIRRRLAAESSKVARWSSERAISCAAEQTAP
nr:hypothetical protein GCM10020092_057090 [Actinoplanes digitatis]